MTNRSVQSVPTAMAGFTAKVKSAIASPRGLISSIVIACFSNLSHDGGLFTSTLIHFVVCEDVFSTVSSILLWKDPCGTL